MIYIDTHSRDICYNLAAEYYFSGEKRIGEVFMLWQTKPTLIIGRFQNALEEINMAYARENNVKLCRRLSGGGTIYSDEENLMFTFISQSAEGGIDFARFVTPVIDALRLVGVQAELSGRNDIMVDGRKVSGNAQYRNTDAVIHHGTLLVGSNLDALVRATTPREYKLVSKAIKSVRERVTNLSEHLPIPMTVSEVKEHLAHTIADAVYEVTAEDERRIREIARLKFDDERITFAAVPKFDMEKSVRTGGGEYVFSLAVRGGRIESASLTGDFFASASAEEITDALVMCEYSPSAVRGALAPLEAKLYKTSAAELAAGLFE